jgi:hypothetical protein
MKTLEDWSAEVSTNCACLDETETGEEVEAANCHGCGDWMLEGAHELLEEWQRRNNYPEAVLVQGSRIGWRGLSGYAFIRENGSEKITKELLSKLMLDGDFTLNMQLEGNTCKIGRYSHDEPTGASFTLEPFAPCQGWSDCQAVENLQELDGVKYCAWCLDIELANQ